MMHEENCFVITDSEFAFGWHFYIVSNLEKLEKGSFEIMEPKDSCERAKKIDCVLIPTVGVSKSCIRLGNGKGYYDRFLSLIDAVKIS